MIKSFEVTHHANDDKVEHIKKIIALQQENVFVLCEWLTNYYCEHGTIPRYLPAEVGLLCDTSMHQKDAYNQVRATFVAWDATLRNKGRDIITGMDIDNEQLRKELYTINKYGVWLHPENIKKLKASDLAVELSRDLFRQLLAENSTPVIGATPTVSFCHSNSIYYKSASKTTHHGHWITLQSETPRKPIYVPIEETDYFANAGGKRNGTVTFKVTEGGDVKVLLSKTLPDPEPCEREGVIALDWGFVTMFATSDGRLLGRQTHDWLLKHDEELQALEKHLNKLGVPLKKSRRWRKLNHRIREYITNEVGRILNIIEDEKWKEIVVEALDFRGKGFSKRMNRILQRAGRAAVRRKLADLELRGILITHVNAAFSSQECNECHYVDRANRNGEKFECLHCYRKAHADIKGTNTIQARRSRPNGWLHLSVQAVLAQLEREFIARFGYDFHTVRERIENEEKRPCYRAVGNELDRTTTAGHVVAPSATDQLVS